MLREPGSHGTRLQGRQQSPIYVLETQEVSGAMFKIVNHLLLLVAKLFPSKKIEIDGDLYLQRYYIWGKRPNGMTCREVLPFLRTLYLHCFWRPDKDRDLHNHPWDTSWTFILLGGYDEERLTEGQGLVPIDDDLSELPTFLADMYNPGIVLNTRKVLQRAPIHRSTFHRVHELHQTPTWTLFSPGTRCGRWGFLSRDLTTFRLYGEENSD
jgi:hypothetical protein